MKGSRHEVCPQCGKRTFKPYIDSQTGKPAGGQYGRCERINTCQYMMYPKVDKQDDWQPARREVEAPRPIEYVRDSLVEDTFRNFGENIFFRWLVKMFGSETALALQSAYNLGTASGGGVIFWQQDRQHRFRTGKVMYYQPTGRRDKTRHSWFVHKKIREDFNYQQCFFGLHLATHDKPVALCESEKTAVVMSVLMPDYTWLAAGGSEMLSIDRLMELPRLDMVFADNGQAEKWAQRTRLFAGRRMDGSVDLAVERGELEPGSDILDLYIKKTANGKEKENEKAEASTGTASNRA